MDSFGKITYKNGAWFVKCEPQVRIRLKRMFARLAESSGSETLKISDTIENCRDLEWFLQRYPMYVDPADVFRRQAAAHREAEQRMKDLFANRVPVPRVPLAKPARDYQEVVPVALGIKGGLLLADDVGVGKTISAICALVDPANLPAVIVVPAHLPRHWKEKIAEFAPQLTAHVVRSSTPYPLVKVEHGPQRALLSDRPPDVLICSYHKLRGWSGVLADLVRLVVFEECQQLRNSDSMIYQACRGVTSKQQRVLGLSATPIYNYGGEFFHVIDALIPGALGAMDEFMREWCTRNTAKPRIKNAEAFGHYLRREGIMLRRTRRDVGRDLPPVTKIAHTVDTDLDVFSKLEGSAVALARVVMQHNETWRGEKMQAAGEFDALMRQATGIAKAPYVAEFVRLLIESGESVVLFGWHREVYRIWQERLAEFNPLLYTGTESPAEKANAEAQFKARNRKLLIMSLRSGAGVDGLQKVCRTVVFGELDWAPGVHEQCLGRIDRDGQKDLVMSYYMVSEAGADPIMSEVLGIKRQQIEDVRNPGGDLIERLETGEQHIRRLAAEFLRRRGEHAPEPQADEPMRARAEVA